MERETNESTDFLPLLYNSSFHFIFCTMNGVASRGLDGAFPPYFPSDGWRMDSAPHVEIPKNIEKAGASYE